MNHSRQCCKQCLDFPLPLARAPHRDVLDGNDLHGAVAPRNVVRAHAVRPRPPRVTADRRPADAVPANESTDEGTLIDFAVVKWRKEGL
jgi:hypothetical protein